MATAPTAALAPGQPAPTAAAPAAAPAAPATAPTATAEPASTGDPLTDQMNAVKAQQAADRAPTSALVKLTLAKGEKQSYQVQLPGPPFCHTYAAVGADTVKNLDIAIASPTGTAEAQDDTEEATAVIANHCPTVAGPYTLTVTSTKGKGEIAVQVFSK